MAPEKEELFYKAQIGHWKSTLKVDEPTKSKILQVWENLRAATSDTQIALPKIEKAPEIDGIYFMVWHRENFHLAVHLFEKPYFFFRKNGFSYGMESSEAPEPFIEAIKEWKPPRESESENRAEKY